MVSVYLLVAGQNSPYLLAHGPVLCQMKIEKLCLLLQTNRSAMPSQCGRVFNLIKRRRKSLNNRNLEKRRHPYRGTDDGRLSPD